MTESSADRARKSATEPMTTWNDATPPDLPPVTAGGRLVGYARVATLVLVTAVALALFLIGRALRAVLGRFVTFHFGVARLWARICLSLCGLRLRVHGRPVASGALVANHASWIDILALRSVRLVYFVSKAEVAAWPGIGYIARVTGTVFINRRRAEAKAQETILRARIAAEQLLCFFPEGTSTDSLRVLPFKSSLFSAFYDDGRGTEIPIQPVTIRYRVAPGRDLPVAFYGWWGSMSFEGHIWDVVTRSHGGEVEVVFHPPVTAAEFPDRKALAERCQNQVATSFNGGAGMLEEARQSGTREG